MSAKPNEAIRQNASGKVEVVLLDGSKIKREKGVRLGFSWHQENPT